MRAIAILSLSGLVSAAAGGAVVVIGLSLRTLKRLPARCSRRLVARWLSRGRLIRLGSLRRISIV